MQAFEAAEADVKVKAEELREIAESYEKAKNLADTIKGVEVDITIQLQEYAKVPVVAITFLFCFCFVFVFLALLCCLVSVFVAYSCRYSCIPCLFSFFHFCSFFCLVLCLGPFF